MNTDPRLEQRITGALDRAASTREPDGLLDLVLSTVGRTRTRPRWLALIKEPPMRIHSRVAVGSPTVRLAYLLILTLLLTLLATGAVVAGASLLPSPAIVVAQDGTGTVRTITEAVAMAKDGDTVLVKPGTYAEAVTITGDITLRGDGDRGVVVIEFAVGGLTYPLDGEPFAYGILLDGSDANLENLTVRGPADDGSFPAVSAFLIFGGAPVIDGVDIVLSGDRWAYGDGGYYRRSAFQIDGGSTAVVRDSTWDGYARMSGLPNSPTFQGNVITGQHIAVAGGGQEPVIRGNTFLEGGAIRWDDTGSGGIAEDNDIDGWIGVDEYNEPTIRGNRIRHGGTPDPSYGDLGAAIKVSNGATPVIERNEISDSATGMQIIGTFAKPRITGNSIHGSTDVAIVVEQGATPSIEGNGIERNGIGIRVLGNSTPVMTGNSFCDNGTDLVVPDGSTITLEGNTVCGNAASAAP